MTNFTPDFEGGRLVICPFDKHKGKSWTQVVKADTPYVEFLLSPDCEVELDDEMAEFLEDLLEDFYDGEIE